MRFSLLLGRDNWMRFHTRSYQTLAPTHMTAAFSVNYPSRTSFPTLTTAPLRISTAVRDSGRCPPPYIRRSRHDPHHSPTTGISESGPPRRITRTNRPLHGRYSYKSRRPGPLRTFRSFRSTNDPSYGPSRPQTGRHFGHYITPTSTRTLGDLGSTRHTA